MKLYPAAAFSRSPTVSVLAVLAFALAVPATTAWAQVGTQNKFSATRAVINNCTIPAASFSNMPGMTRTFTIGGSTSEEVVVTFQASWSGSAIQFDTAFVRLTIDGAVQPTNNAVPIFAGADGTYTHGFTWISGPLAPGGHTARVQWRTDLGSSFCVDDRTLVVLHK